uniref:Uncharacterized protein n=1 Tax=Rhizophagus irregularis (strain DAOM 181602 / DAOM 197198 / MUCL 43194) TaxID=747089 RepID=U9TK62_RHIID
MFVPLAQGERVNRIQKIPRFLFIYESLVTQQELDPILVDSKNFDIQIHEDI